MATYYHYHSNKKTPNPLGKIEELNFETQFMLIPHFVNCCSSIKFLVLGVLTFFCSTHLNAQQSRTDSKNKFDSIYFETAVVVSAKDINRAIHIADSLYKNSTLEIHQLKALMLSSTLLQQKGEMKKSIDYALLADKIASNNKFYDWEARIAGSLSTQYRIVGLLDQGKKYLEKGKEVSKLIDNKEISTLYQGLIYQETAHYGLESENYKESYKAVKASEKYFNRIADEVNKNYFLATNDELLGRVCIGLERWDEALLHYTNAIERLSRVTEQDAMLNGIIYSGLGEVYLKKDERDLALEYLQKAEEIVVNSDNLELKIELYKTFTEYYKLEEDYKEFAVYQDKYINAFELGEKKKKQLIDSFVNSVQSREKDVSQNRNILLVTSIVLFVLIISGIVWHRKSKKRDFERFKIVMSKLKEDQAHRLTVTTNTEKEKSQDTDKKKMISSAVELKILNGLVEFEKTEKYTDKQISLATLAGIINTNTKYLSYVLNTNKNKDFSTYINELRVNYIIEKLEKHDTFKKYKISYLAEEAGFSSHSKFSAVFKSVTGFSPSTFLEFLNKDK